MSSRVLGWGKFVFWMLELTDTPTNLAIQIKVGHALDQSRSAQSHGPERAHQNNKPEDISKHDKNMIKMSYDFMVIVSPGTCSFNPSRPLCCIYASMNWVNIGSDNGLSPVCRQAIIWTNAGLLSIGPMETNFSDILIAILSFSFKKIYLKISCQISSHFVQGGDKLI